MAAVFVQAAVSFLAFAALTVAVPAADVPVPLSDPQPAPTSAPAASRVVASVAARSGRGVKAILSGRRQNATGPGAPSAPLIPLAASPAQRGGGPPGPPEPPPGPIGGIGSLAAPCCVTGVPRKHPIVYGKAVVAW